MNIAIIGTGISGLTCAYLLHRQHDIKVFEADDRIGGHTATQSIEWNDQRYAIDTGFIVFNDWTYPNFIQLMDQLGVPSRPTSMSFSVVNEQRALEYGGSSIAALFAQRRNWFNRHHWGMLREIVRFNREAITALNRGELTDGLTLREFLERKRYSTVFRDNYLIPMGSAIWSASPQDMLDIPVLFFVQFFKNHGLLSIKNRPQWRVIEGGSNRYLTPLTEGFRHRIRLNSRIRCVQRTHQDVELIYWDGTTETFDEVVFACHSDQALRLLADRTPDEQSILGCIPYASNDVVLHTDRRLLPSQQAAWSSWNYRVTDQASQPPVLSYNMNLLQGIKSDSTFIVTLNATDRIRPETILGRYQYAHPQFSLDSVHAQQQWHRINGVNRTWFCGAYWRYGFHEDGCVSAIRVANRLGGFWELSDDA